jgi:hypothetical protein
MNRSLLLTLLMFGVSACEKAVAADPSSHDSTGTGRTVWDRVRFFPAPNMAKDMLGGKFSGSNESYRSGYENLAEITAVPKEGEWTEIKFTGTRPCRWLRYEGAPGSHGRIAEIEFYAGDRRLGGQQFGSIDTVLSHATIWVRAFDGKTDTWFGSNRPDGQSVGIDIGDQATAIRPQFDPAPGPRGESVEVTLRTPTPGAVIRYTLDGTTPAAGQGTLYERPIKIPATTTIVAVAFHDKLAPSPPSTGTYRVGDPTPPRLSTFHIGNSQTQTTHDLAKYLATAGYEHEYHAYLQPGILTYALWEKDVQTTNERWNKTFAEIKRIDHFTVQPRDFDLAREVKHQQLFYQMMRQKTPDMQPWLYCEWTELARQRPTDKGEVPSREMTKVYPALTWEESSAAMLLYIEELQQMVLENYPEGKRPRVIPTGIACGWLKNLLDNGKIPGLGADDFEPIWFFDSVHPGREGKYLIDLTWYAAFYGQSPEGKILPIETSLTAAQATAFQRLAWETVRNYPDCGLYQEGSEPANAPQFHAGQKADDGVTKVTLASATPDAWFRYTLDGTTPTRTRGYIYCGVISARPGMTIKAVAYRSGLADSQVAEASY